MHDREHDREGWHHSFDLPVDITHPMIRRLVAKLLEEHAHNRRLLEQVPALIPLPPPMKNY